MKRQFAVLGLGRFGSNLAIHLAQKGYPVLALDKEEKLVQHCADCVTLARMLDCTDLEALREVGVANCDVAVVAMGHDLESSILSVVAVKELGVAKVIAKAMGDIHGKILLKVGADEVVYPEKDMAIRLANRLTFSNLLDFIELSPEYSLAEEKAPSRFIGKTVTELNSRQESGLSIVAIKHNDHIMIGPTGNHRIQSGDALVIIGETAKVNAFIKD